MTVLLVLCVGRLFIQLCIRIFIFPFFLLCCVSSVLTINFICTRLALTEFMIMHVILGKTKYLI